jgi:uncharacterized protein (TIGR03083 family)
VFGRNEYLTMIRRETEALLDAAASAPTAPVPTCPEWDGHDLVWHIGEVQHFWGTIVDQRLDDLGGYTEPHRPDDGQLVAWAHDRLAFLLGVLERTPADTPTWTWTGSRTAAWVVRRMAHEAVVHRYDAELTAQRAASIGPEVAADSVDEYLSTFLVNHDVAPGSVHLHATDAAGEWVVRFGDGEPVVTREHAKGDAAMRGPAATLLLALWQRLPLDDVDIVGDRDALDRFFALGVRG